MLSVGLTTVNKGSHLPVKPLHSRLLELEGDLNTLAATSIVAGYGMEKLRLNVGLFTPCQRNQLCPHCRYFKLYYRSLAPTDNPALPPEFWRKQLLSLSDNLLSILLLKLLKDCSSHNQLVSNSPSVQQTQVQSTLSVHLLTCSLTKG